MTGPQPAVPHAYDHLLRSLHQAGLLTASWTDAFQNTPRHLFLPDTFWTTTTDGYQEVDRNADDAAWMTAAYADAAAVTQWDDGHDDTGHIVPTSSASMPTMVAAMLQDLTVHDGHRILEIGTGTGWNAALLARQLGSGSVVTVEFDKQLAAQAVENLAAAGASPLVVVGDGADGWPDAAPYDRILATCSVAHVPAAWLRQTRPGGLIVTPFSPLFGGGAIAQLTIAEPGSAQGHFTRSSAFMLLRQHRYQAPPVDAYLPGDWPGNADQTSTTLDPETLGTNWLASFAVGLTLHDVYYRRTPHGAGWTWWLFDTAVTSWATVDSVPGADSFDVRQSGPRRLWDEIEAAWQQWDHAGQPGFHRYGLTITPAGHHAWLDDPSHPLTPTP